MCDDRQSKDPTTGVFARAARGLQRRSESTRGGLRDEIRCFVLLDDTPIGAQRRFFRLVSFDCPSRESQYRIVVLISTVKKKWW